MKKTKPILLVICIVLITFFLIFYKLLFADNIAYNGNEKYELLIQTGSNYNTVLKKLKRNHILKNDAAFETVAKKLNYNNHVKPGRYLIDKNCGNLFLIRKLRAGDQDAVKITINNIQNKIQLAEKITTKLEASQIDLLKIFNDKNILDSLQLTEDNFPSIFISNTYEFYWNTSAEQFMQRMLKEYTKFWKDSRIEKAKKLNLTPIEVIILASIVQKESNKNDEQSTISGVYYNRLKQGWPLQADPTVMFALNKLGQKRRVYNTDLKIQSPYNTYINKGLPPGPICLPETKCIDNVLDTKMHNYMYFCAKEDFSGYHNFAVSYDDHLANAKKYQKALNDKKIH